MRTLQGFPIEIGIEEGKRRYQQQLKANWMKRQLQEVQSGIHVEARCWKERADAGPSCLSFGCRHQNAHGSWIGHSSLRDVYAVKASGDH